jgi:hypothetical protein
MKTAFSFCIVLLVFSLAAFGADQPVGKVKTYQPVSFIFRNGVESPVDAGTPVHVGDRIVTRSQGAVGIIFVDGSVLSLGPDTEFIIDELTFHPAAKDVSFLSRVLHGTATFLSGAIGRISPESVKFKTPTATLGLRGTKVLIKVR